MCIDLVNYLKHPGEAPTDTALRSRFEGTACFPMPWPHSHHSCFSAQASFRYSPTALITTLAAGRTPSFALITVQAHIAPRTCRILLMQSLRPRPHSGADDTTRGDVMRCNCVALCCNPAVAVHMRPHTLRLSVCRTHSLA